MDTGAGKRFAVFRFDESSHKLGSMLELELELVLQLAIGLELELAPGVRKSTGTVAGLRATGTVAGSRATGGCIATIRRQPVAIGYRLG